jgi:hypothetical protein
MNDRLRFGVNPPTGVQTAWGARWIIDPDGRVDQVWDRIDAIGPDDRRRELWATSTTTSATPRSRPPSNCLRAGRCPGPTTPA